MIGFDPKIFGKNRLAGSQSGTFASRTGNADNIKIFAFEFLKPANFFDLKTGKETEID